MTMCIKLVMNTLRVKHAAASGKTTARIEYFWWHALNRAEQSFARWCEYVMDSAARRGRTIPHPWEWPAAKVKDEYEVWQDYAREGYEAAIPTLAILETWDKRTRVEWWERAVLPLYGHAQYIDVAFAREAQRLIDERAARN